MLYPVKSINDNMLTDEALEALMQEEWLDALGELKNEYRNIPVPNEARDAVQKGIQRAKAETEYRIVQPAAPKRSRKLWAALAADTLPMWHPSAHLPSPAMRRRRV